MAFGPTYQAVRVEAGYMRTKVADLKVGHYVKDFGVVQRILTGAASMGLWFPDELGCRSWPLDAYVSTSTEPARRPFIVFDIQAAGPCRYSVRRGPGADGVAWFADLTHAEAYARKLNNDPTLTTHIDSIGQA